MKDLDRRIRQGGDDAIAAASEMLPRWISVEERLPELQQDVLAHSHDTTGVARMFADGWYWESDDGWFTQINPTHWMPLPEPPEVK